MDSGELSATRVNNRLKSSSVSVDSVLKSSSLDGHSPSSEELPPYQEIVAQDVGNADKSIKSDSSQFCKYSSGYMCFMKQQ